ncbi:MAG: hypothetical protein ACXWYS_09010 [Gaiellaceae bacterium]
MGAECLVCPQVGGGATGGLLIDAPLVAAFHVEPVEDQPAAADEWEGVPRGGAEEIAQLADRLRAALA